MLDNIHGGAIYNIKTDSLNTVYERYFNENNYRHIISYTSTLERIESDYSLKMIFPEQNMTYDLKIILPFYENLKINSFTACPFIVEMEGSVCLSCLTSIKDVLIILGMQILESFLILESMQEKFIGKHRNEKVFIRLQ